jgi:transcriptional antiterminator RfaH
MESPLSWYAIVININCYARATYGLEQLGCDVYLPTYLKRVVHARQESLRERPLFARYMFLGWPGEGVPWGFVTMTNGVQAVLRNQGAPVKIPDLAISNIRAAQCMGVFDEKLLAQTKQHDFKPGETVKIIGGPFADRMAKIKDAPPEERIHVLIDLFGRETPAKIAVDELRRIV